MKKFILLSVLFFAFAFTAHAQKFAFIDMEYIAKNIPAFEKANQQIEEASKKYQGEVEAVAKQAQTLYQSYQTQATKLTEQQKTQKEEAIVAKEKEGNELRRKYFGQDGELAKMQKDLISPLQDDIYEAVRSVAESQGYAAIIDRASASSVIFASPRIDISDEILSKLGYSN